MDSSINSDTGTDSSGSSGGSQICAPLDAFSIGGTPPAVGDEVSFKVKGTVSRVDGGNAYVTPQDVNGSPVMQDSMNSGEPDEDDLRQNAQNVDTQQYASGGVAKVAHQPKDQRGMSPNTVEDLYKPNVPYNRYGGGSDKRGGAPHGA